jgi:transposase-like protein
MTRAFTHEHDPEIARLYQAGETTYEIASRFGVTPPVIARALKRHGVPLRPGGVSPEWEATNGNRRDLVAAYEAGESIRTIARRLQIHTRRVTRILDESDLGWRHPGGKLRFGDDEAEEFARAYRAGEGLVQIGRRYGVSAKVIRDYLIRADVPLRPVGVPAFWTEQRKAEALRLHHDGSTIKDIARTLGCGRSTVSRQLRELGIPNPYSDRDLPRGEAHPSWQGGRITDSSGYVRVKVPGSEQHLSDGTRTSYMMEHRLVMARMLGRRLLKSETVHHINGDRQNNEPGNLQLRQGKHGTGAVFRCASCGSHDIKAVPLDGDAA